MGSGESHEPPGRGECATCLYGVLDGGTAKLIKTAIVVMFECLGGNSIFARTLL